jgi:hypothetical protein
MRYWKFIKDNDREKVLSKVNEGVLCRMDVLEYAYRYGGVIENLNHPYVIIYFRRLEENVG